MGSPCVLVVDDNEDIRQLVRVVLESSGYSVQEAEHGRQALRMLYESPPDLVLLDVAMPELDGWETLERMRDVSGVPVLMLTARAEEQDKVRGLRHGADDFVTKPFGIEELVARVDALLRRSERPTQVDETYQDELVRVDFGERRVSVAGIEVALTPLEFTLLAAFVRHAGHLLTHEQLLQLVWNDPVGAGRDQLKLYVGYLRRKLAAAAPGSAPIETVRGFGYRYCPPEGAAATQR